MYTVNHFQLLLFQNSANYIVPKLVCYAQTLPIILEGANLYVQIIILLCDVKHLNCNTNLKPGLGTHWEIYLAIA